MNKLERIDFHNLPQCFLQIWLLTCILFVFLALFEYAVLLYLKNMKGVQKRIFRAGILVVTPSKDPDGNDCWGNQQTEGLENKLKVRICQLHLHTKT